MQQNGQTFNGTVLQLPLYIPRHHLSSQQLPGRRGSTRRAAAAWRPGTTAVPAPSPNHPPTHTYTHTHTPTTYPPTHHPYPTPPTHPHRPHLADVGRLHVGPLGQLAVVQVLNGAGVRLHRLLLQVLQVGVGVGGVSHMRRVTSAVRHQARLRL